MAIKSNRQTFVPARQAYKQEITLLSHGYHNKTAFPGGKITVFPWDKDVDEWIAQRVRKPRKERLLWELLSKLCNLNGSKVEDFLLGDLNTVLLVSRAIVHKNTVSYQPVCEHCATPGEREAIQVPDELEKVGEKTEDYIGWDEIELPESKDRVRLRPLRVQDEIDISNRDKKFKEMVSEDLAHLLAAIVEIGNSSGEFGQPENIQEVLMWYEALHPQDKAYLDAQQQMMFPHLDTTIYHTCETCGKEYEHKLSLDTNFFRRGSASVTG